MLKPVTLLQAAAATFFGVQAAYTEEACVLPAYGAGSQLFAENCTVCHGRDGKGGGELAKALNLSPPDLTVLTRASGRFPSGHVLSVLKEGAGRTAQGDKAMPVWSKIFAHECGDAFGQKAVAAIGEYLEEIQKP